MLGVDSQVVGVGSQEVNEADAMTDNSESTNQFTSIAPPILSLFYTDQKSNEEGEGWKTGNYQSHMY